MANGILAGNMIIRPNGWNAFQAIVDAFDGKQGADEDWGLALLAIKIAFDVVPKNSS